MQLACSQNDMFPSLLLERLHARICLGKQLQPTNELGHISGMFGLHRDTNDGSGLQIPTVRTIHSNHD